MTVKWRLYEDGSFDLIDPKIALKRCYPAMDGVPVRPIALDVRQAANGGTIRYDLAGGRLMLAFSVDGDAAVLRAELKGMTQAPHDVSPLSGASVQGTNRFFRQGHSLGGPSGFVVLPADESLESFTVSALLAEDNSTMTVAANDHSRFLQRSVLTPEIGDRGKMRLDVAFATECIPLGDGSLELPPLYFRMAPDPWTGLRKASAVIGETMCARTQQPASYHWCSWYYLYQHQTETDLDEYLKGLAGISPRVPLQTIQIDAGYFPSTGDWLEPWYRFPSGMQAALGNIRKAGYRPGMWIAPTMVGNRSRLAAEHPDWLLRDSDNALVVMWRSYGEGRLWGYRDEEIYQLDTSHPDAMDYLRRVFRTFRKWGAEFFKADMILWGLHDSTKVKRHGPGKTSVEYVRDMMEMIREEIGEESFLLACYAPLTCGIGYADAMRIAHDVGPSWDDPHNPKNMIAESYALQHFNNVWYQNDPDVVILRDFHVGYNDEEARSLALWQGILGGSVNTSDPLHKIAPERLRLWRFLQPSDNKWTARLPYYGSSRELLVAVREFDNVHASAVLVFNPSEARSAEELKVSDLVGKQEAFVYAWRPGRAESIGKRSSLLPILGAHECVLYYLNDENAPPPQNLTLGGVLA